MPGSFEKNLSSVPAIFDAYGRQARLYPALLVVLPLFLLVVASFPDLITSTSAATLLTVASSCGLLYAAASLARTLGKREEKRILSEKGGWPTTLLLRHSSRLDAFSRARYHAYLAKSIPDLVFPTREDEATRLADADDVYASAIKWLKERTRGKEFPLVEKENTQYGFRRNLLGLKKIAIMILLFVIILGVLILIYRIYTGGMIAFSAERPVIGVVIFGMLATGIWTVLVKDGWVWEAGEQYAEALLATCDQLNTESSSPQKKKASPRVRSVGQD